MNMARIIKSGGVALVLAGLANPAKADVIETGSISLQNVADYAGAGLNIILPQYNASPGSLTGIQITVNTSALANISVQNNDPLNSYQFQNASAAALIQLSGPASYTSYINTVATLASGIAYPNQATGYPGITGSNGSIIDVSPSNLSAYEGGGNIMLNFLAPLGNASFSGTAIGAPSNTVYFGGGDQLAIDVTLDYETPNHDSIPEPATCALLGTGMVTVAGVRRRRKRA